MKPLLLFTLALILVLTFMTALVVHHDRTVAKPEPTVAQPQGEPTPSTTLPAASPVAAWYGGHPATDFITTSEGKNVYGIYMWHGTIDGIECLIYGNAMMCRGFPATTSAP